MSTQSDPGDGAANPPGARLLSAQEAIDALVTGDHPDSSQGSLAMDGGLLELLRQGEVIACRLRDGRLAFTRTLNTPG